MIYWSSFLLLFRVLVYILINVTNFLRNKRFVYIFHGQKLCYLEKIEFVRKLMHFERDDAENVAKRRYIGRVFTTPVVSLNIPEGVMFTD